MYLSYVYITSVLWKQKWIFYLTNYFVCKEDFWPSFFPSSLFFGLIKWTTIFGFLMLISEENLKGEERQQATLWQILVTVPSSEKK